MEKTFISVRDVDEETFRRFRALSVEEKMKLGEALTLAMRKMIQEKIKRKLKSREKIRPPLLKPISFGKGTEKLSSEIDKILYGK